MKVRAEIRMHAGSLQFNSDGCLTNVEEPGGVRNYEEDQGDGVVAMMPTAGAATDTQ